MLREEKNRLTELQTMQREDFNARREHERELRYSVFQCRYYSWNLTSSKSPA